MGLAEDFQELAVDFINDDFVDLAKPMTMRLADAPVFGTPQTYTTEVGTAIELTIALSKFESSLIEVGDALLFTDASQWTTNPRTSNVDVLFDGSPWQIILVEKDAADAAYFLTVRRK